MFILFPKGNLKKEIIVMVMSYFGKNVSEERTCEAFIISLFNWNIVDLNAVLVSGVQHNDSVTHTHTHTHRRIYSDSFPF